MTDTIARQLAGFVASCSVETLPPAVMHRTKLHVMDTLGAMVAGAGEASSRIVADVVSNYGGQGDCTVVGYGFRTSATAAALINGTMGHAVEIDDDHRTSGLHPGVVVLPAALAMAENCGAGGRALLEGVVAGYEVMTRLGDAFRGSQDRYGFHSTGTCGVFGAAAAAGRILGLNRDQLIAALGIAGSQAAGLQEWKSDGSWTKRLHPGRAAESGVFSTLLAAQGYTGPDTIFEGPHGFLKAYSFGQMRHENLITRDLGTEYRGADTAFKPFACCRFSHQLIDAVLLLVERHGVVAEEVERCLVRIYRSGHQALFEPVARCYRPATVVDAQFSAPFVVAVSILHGAPLPIHFTEKMLSDSQVLELADRVKGSVDDEYEKAFPDSYSTHVTIRLKDGREFATFEGIGSGDPAKLIYSEQPGRFEDEITSKFRTLLEAVPAFHDRAELILREIHRLEEMDSVADLSRHLIVR